jgi:hypothetical protein
MLRTGSFHEKSVDESGSEQNVDVKDTDRNHFIRFNGNYPRSKATVAPVAPVEIAPTSKAPGPISCRLIWLRPLCASDDEKSIEVVAIVISIVAAVAVAAAAAAAAAAVAVADAAVVAVATKIA